MACVVVVVESVVEETEDEDDVAVVVLLVLAIPVAIVDDDDVMLVAVGDSTAGFNPRFNTCPARSPTENITANATTIITLLTAIFRRIILFSTVLNEEKAIFELCLSVFPNSIKGIILKYRVCINVSNAQTNY